LQPDCDIPANTSSAVSARALPTDRALLMVEMDDLITLDPDALRARWVALFGQPVSRSVPSHKLARAIAYRLQAHCYGVEDTLIAAPGVLRLSRLNDGVTASVVLRRFWKGEEHQVTRDGDAFLYNDKRYGSLSAVARAITGTRWNGWTFFGLKGPATTKQRPSV
jgi:hypothetical protein